jgi:hypothetical protein
MKLDKPAFLALVTLISGATAACNAPVDDAGEQTGASSAASCIKPTDTMDYPVEEGCYSANDPQSCMVFADHFYVGVAKASFTIPQGDFNEELFKMLGNVCDGSVAAEKALTTSCNLIAAYQISATDKSMHIRTPGFSFRPATGMPELVTACKDMLRGMKVESRSAVKRCIQKNPSYPVYWCVEGMFNEWNSANKVCTDMNDTARSRMDGCDGSVANECSNIDAMFKAKPASDAKACILETQIILTEDGPGATPAKLREAATSCTASVLSTACKSSDGAAATACAQMVTDLKAADPHLGEKGHINAGGAFTKKCEQAVSGMTPVGVKAMGACIEGAATAVKAGTKQIGSVSVRGCLTEMVGSEG